MLLSTATSSEASYGFALLRTAAKAPNSVSCAQAACFRHSALKEAVAHRSEQRSVVCHDGGGALCSEPAENVQKVTLVGSFNFGSNWHPFEGFT